jgi:Flp pilus assembly CpaF family ATPase
MKMSEVDDLFAGKKSNFPDKPQQTISQVKSEELDSDPVITDKDIEELLNETAKSQEIMTSHFNCLVIGGDGTGKT